MTDVTVARQQRKEPKLGRPEAAFRDIDFQLFIKKRDSESSFGPRPSLPKGFREKSPLSEESPG